MLPNYERKEEKTMFKFFKKMQAKKQAKAEAEARAIAEAEAEAEARAIAEAEARWEEAEAYEKFLQVNGLPAGLMKRGDE